MYENIHETYFANKLLLMNIQSILIENKLSNHPQQAVREIYFGIFVYEPQVMHQLEFQ